MRPIFALMALAAAAASCRAETLDPPERFLQRRDEAEKRVSGFHASLGEYAYREGLLAIARREFLRAVELDPANAEAQAGLGRRLEQGKWVDDPRWPVNLTTDLGTEKNLDAIAKYRAKRRLIAREAAAEYEDLADFAADARLDLESRAMWEAVLRYNPSEPRAQAKLGWRKFSGEFVSGAEADAREAMRTRVAEAPGGKVVTEPSDVEQKMEVTFSRRKSSHFQFEGQYTDGEIRALVRTAEVTRDLFIEAFRLPKETEPPFLHGIFLRFEGDQRRFLEKVTGAGALELKTAGELSTWEGTRPDLFAAWMGERPFDSLRDETVHVVTRYAFRNLTRMEKTPAWLDQGLCAWFGDRVLGSATSCFARAEVKARRDAKTTLRWRRLLREQVWEGTSPRIRDLAKAAPGELTFEMTVKAWSLVDWLMTAKRDRLYDFLARCRTGSSSRALRRALGAKDSDEVEMMWEAWISEGR